MTRAMKLTSWVGAAALVASVASGCSDQAERNASEAARDTRNAAERAADRTADAVKDGASAVGDAVANGGRAADAAVETMDVKAALIADSRVDAGDINVDSDHLTKTVTLKGHVPTAEQKRVAEDIAKAKATGYRVLNELTVGK